MIGGGFGGAVSALRLADEGRSVLVLEQGRRHSPADLLAARTDPRKYLWMPELGLKGFFWQRVLRHVGIIGGAGVGGGSIVWAGVLLEPEDEFFTDPAWPAVADGWHAQLAGHDRTAARMLGRETTSHVGEMDRHLEATARSMGAGETLRAAEVVVAAGVLGTVELLFRSRQQGLLPRVSARLGERVRTNSEAITAVLADDPHADLTRGPTISSGFYPDAATHVTQNRYAGGWHMRLQLGPLVDGADPARRRRAALAELARHPVRQVRLMTARNFIERLSVFTVMQNVENEIRLVFDRSPITPWRRVLRSRAGEGEPAPSYLPQANEVARRFAESVGGRPLDLLLESVGGKSITAHVLGGAAMGTDASDGVIDTDHRVFGHPGLYVVDGSAIPANVGVNPSLTITAMAERFATRYRARRAVSPATETAAVATSPTASPTAASPNPASPTAASPTNGAP
ncbi:GMC oxidoreductase [Dietzia maris]